MIRINTMKFMSIIFKTFVSLLILIGHVEIGYAQTASILPNAKTTYVDQNGKPLVSGTVDFYIPGTTTRKTTWKDAGQSVPNANPVLLDGSGRATILGDGSYRQVLKDRYGNIVWDGYTSSAGSGGGGTTPTVGDGDAVGTVKAWSGFIAPYGYAFAYGQELVRTSYPEAFAVLTIQKNVNCTSGSPTLSGISGASQLPIGAPIESSCLNNGAVIVSRTDSTVIASANAIISTTTTARFYPFGNGDGSLTFNLPDLRGRVIAGNDAMGGVASGRLTSTYFGANPDALGVTGGFQSHSQTKAELPAVAPIYTGTPNQFVSVVSSQTDIPIDAANSNSTNVAGGSNASYARLPSASGHIASQITSTGSFTSAGTISNLGDGDPFTLIQPTQLYNYIIKVIADSNPNSFFGVASVGGMSGVITCGNGVICAGNDISVAPGGYVLPPASLGALGGVFRASPISNNFLIGLDVSGNLISSQPDFTNLSGAIDPSQISSNSIANSKLALMPAATIKGNPTSLSTNVQDFTIQGLTARGIPDGSNDKLVLYNNTTGTLQYVTPDQIASSGVAGVSSLNSLTGGLNLVAGTNITITPAGTNITIASTGGNAVATITSSSAAVINQMYLCDATSGNITINLPNPTSVANGSNLIVKRKDASINTCTLQVSGGANIDTLASLGIEPQNTSYTLTSDGSAQWWIQ